MRKTILLLAVLLGVGACGPSKPADEKAPLFDKTATEENTVHEVAVAQVGPDIITEQQFKQRMAQLDDRDRTFAKTNMGRKLFIQLMAREKLTALDAKDMGLNTSNVYLNALADKKAELQAIYQNYTADLLNRLWLEHYQQNGTLQVTDEEIAAYHKKYPYEMKIKQILLADAQTADMIWRELRRNKGRWKELEQQYSVAPEQSRGKEISFMPGEFISELEVIAANTPTGSMQGFVKTAQGFHIIMKTGEQHLSLKDAAPRIRKVLENKKMDDLLNKLQNKYEVIVYEQND